jgi:DNA-binding CsgD family transcriptional regulator
MPDFTPWELRVASTIAQGYTRAEAAEILSRAEPSIQSALKQLAVKTQARNTIQMIVTLDRLGLLEQPAAIVPDLPDEAGPVMKALHVRLVSCLDLREFRELRDCFDKAVRRGW